MKFHERQLFTRLHLCSVWVGFTRGGSKVYNRGDIKVALLIAVELSNPYSPPARDKAPKIIIHLLEKMGPRSAFTSCPLCGSTDGVKINAQTLRAHPAALLLNFSERDFGQNRICGKPRSWGMSSGRFAKLQKSTCLAKETIPHWVGERKHTAPERRGRF